MFPKVQLATTIAILLMASGFANAADKMIDKTLAVVNGDAIMQSEFDKTAAPILEQYQQSVPPANQSADKIAEIKKKLLDQMVDERLLKQEAKKDKIKVTKRDLEDGMKTVKKRFDNEEDFQKELRREDISQPAFEKRIEDQLMVMKLIEQEVKAKTPRPSDDAVKALFEKINNRIAKGVAVSTATAADKDEEELNAMTRLFSRVGNEQVHARHILVAVDKNASLADKSAALKKIKDIKSQLTKGADFAELASKYSDDPGSKAKGGDLGYFTKGDMVPEFEKAAFSLNVGQVSEPVQTDFGWHIIKIEEKRAGKKVTFADAQNDLTEFLFQKAAEKRYEDWLADLHAKASIKVNSAD
jgi:parvulin-like peptidyl-prolyl isomerase